MKTKRVSLRRFGRVNLSRGFRIVWIWYADDPRRTGDPRAIGRVDWSLTRIGRDKKSCPALKGSQRCLLPNAERIVVNRAFYPIYRLGEELAFAANGNIFFPEREHL
jgi:hypothetical protein